MAVIEIKDPSSLRVRLQLPLVDGKPKTRTKSFGYLKASATAQDVFDVGSAIMGLQEHTVMEIIKQDNTIIGE